MRGDDEQNTETPKWFNNIIKIIIQHHCTRVREITSIGKRDCEKNWEIGIERDEEKDRDR